MGGVHRGHHAASATAVTFKRGAAPVLHRVGEDERQVGRRLSSRCRRQQAEPQLPNAHPQTWSSPEAADGVGAQGGPGPARPSLHSVLQVRLEGAGSKEEEEAVGSGQARQGAARRQGASLQADGSRKRRAPGPPTWQLRGHCQLQGQQQLVASGLNSMSAGRHSFEVEHGPHDRRVVLAVWRLERRGQVLPASQQRAL